MSDNADGVERRKSLRLDMEKELVDIVWLDDNGTEQSKSIACLDFARGGLKLECDQALDVNRAVTVVFKSANARNQKLYGKVLRCIEKANNHFEIALILEKSD